MNEGTGATTADASGNGFTDTLSGGASWGSGVASNAIALDGSTGNLSVGDKSALEDNAAWTFAGWVNPSAFNSTREVVS